MTAPAGTPPKRLLSSSAREAPQHVPVVDEETRRRRGLVDDEARAAIVTRARQARAAVSLGHATRRYGNALGRAQSEPALFFSSPSARFASGVDVLERLSHGGNGNGNGNGNGYGNGSGGSSLSALRAGWRDNELAPMWERDRELEGVRTLSRTAALQGGGGGSSGGAAGGGEDGFSLDELAAAGGFSAPASAPGFPPSNPTKRGRDAEAEAGAGAEAPGREPELELELTDSEGEGPPGPLPPLQRLQPALRPLRPIGGGGARRGFKATQSMPAGALFGARPPAPRPAPPADPAKQKDVFALDEDF